MKRGVPIRSVSRAISVLQEINQWGSLSMMQIAKFVQRPYPTAFRIVQTLIHEGLIEQEPSRKFYRATPLVQSLAQGFQVDSIVVEQARSHIRALTQKVGWPVSLTVRVGTNMVVRDSTHSDTSLTFERYYPGFRLPLMDCASGRVCLAYMSQEELDSTINWISQVGAPEEQEMIAYVSVNSLIKIREEGYAAIGWGQHNLTPGKTSTIAVPVFRDGKFEAALTLIYFSAAMKQAEAIERHLEDLKQTAADVTAALAASDLEARGEA